MSKTVLTQVGRALKQLGIEHIPAYSPQARGRSERMFGTLQDRLPKELKLAGIDTVEAANRWLSDSYMAEHNKRFAISAAQEGSAFVADAMGAWREILCIQEDRTVGNDNTVKWERLSLQLPPSRLRSHFVKATVRVHAYPDGRLAVFWGPHRLADYDARGSIIQPEPCTVPSMPSSVRAEGPPPVDLWATPRVARGDGASDGVAHNSTGASPAEARWILFYAHDDTTPAYAA